MRAAVLHLDHHPPVPLLVTTNRRDRARGLLGRTGFAGALLLVPCRSVHTWGMPAPIDVALLDRDLVVLAVRSVPPRRVVAPGQRARAVLEAPAGALARWGVAPGERLTISAGTTPPAR